MIIAHLPSGYIFGHLLQRRLPDVAYVLPAAVVGGILPDFDMIWFYLIDDRAVHHHRYWVHIPMVWALVAAVTLPLIALLSRRFLIPATVFFGALLLHLCLDTISGDILWQWPWSDTFFSLITVPARFDAWILNFILHPVFVLELIIWGFALFLWRTRT